MGSPLLATATCLVLVASPWASRWARPRLARLPELWLDVAGGAALVLATASAYREMAAGAPPTSTDHNFHLLKALETAQLLRRGELFGWSDLEWAGFPHNVHYPFAGSLLTVALHALPGVDWPRAYAWSVLAAILAMVLSVYVATRLHLPRAVALLAGLFALLDPGDIWVGGHHNAVQMGMWIQTFSTGLLVLALGLLPKALLEPAARYSYVLVVGLVLALAILFHPQALVLLASAMPPMLVAILGRRDGPPVADVASRLAQVLGVAFLGSAFWLVPYLATRSSGRLPNFEPLGAQWMFRSLVEAKLFSQPAMYTGAVLAGLLALGRSREPFARFVALYVPACVLFSKDSLELLHLRPTSGPPGLVDEFQLARLFMLMRPLAMVAAACALGRYLPSLLAGRPGWRSMLTRAWVGGVAAIWLLMPGLPQEFPGTPEHALPQAPSPQDANDYARLLQQALPRVPVSDRIAVYVDPGQGGDFEHGLLGPLALTGRRTLKIGWDAAAMYQYRFSSTRPEVLGRLGVTLLISKGPPPKEFASMAMLAKVGVFEARVLKRQPRAWLDGPGSVRVLGWEDEAITVEVSGARPESRLRLGLGYYDAWAASDGARPEPFPFFESTLTSLPARDGRLTLTYRAPRAQRLGLALSLLGLVGLGALAWNRRPRAAIWLPSPAPVGGPDGSV